MNRNVRHKDLWAEPPKKNRGLGQQSPQGSQWFSGLADESGKATNHSFLENVWFVGLGTPDLPKNNWPNKNHFGILLKIGVWGSSPPRGEGGGGGGSPSQEQTGRPAPIPPGFLRPWQGRGPLSRF